MVYAHKYNSKLFVFSDNKMKAWVSFNRESLQLLLASSSRKPDLFKRTRKPFADFFTSSALAMSGYNRPQLLSYELTRPREVAVARRKFDG